MRKIRFWTRGKKGFEKLFYILEHSSNHYVKASAIQTAKDMRTVFNQKEINAGLEKAIDSLEYEYQKEDIKKYIQTKEQVKILLLDQETAESHNFLNIWERKRQTCMSVPQDCILLENREVGTGYPDERR